MVTVTRRAFLWSAASVVAAPLAAGAQQARTIGLISMVPRTPTTDAAWDALATGLREHGWIEGRTLVIDRRYVEPRQAAAVVAAEELVHAGVEVIVVASTPAALGARPGLR